MSPGQWKKNRIPDDQINLREGISNSNFIVSAVPADGLAPLGAKSFAGTVMTKAFHTYTTSTWTAKTVSKPVILSS